MPQGLRSGARSAPVLGFVSFGSERVDETAELSLLLRAGRRLEFFTVGHSPVSLEILVDGPLLNLGGAGGFGPEFKGEVPLVATVPGAPFASVETINVKAGRRSDKERKKTVYYGRVPNEVPEGRLPAEDRSDLR